MRRPRGLGPLLLVSTLLSALSVRPVEAGLGDQGNVRIAVHLVPKPTKGSACGTAPQGGFGCLPDLAISNVVAGGHVGVSYYQYIVLLEVNVGPGVSEVVLGIDYDGAPQSGVDLFGAETCSDAESPDANWPHNPPSGNTITWNWRTNCQGTVDPSDIQGDGYVIAYGFYAYAYSPGTFSIIRHPAAEPDFQVRDCTTAESNLAFPRAAGRAGYGVCGYDPCNGDQECAPTPVRETTWGGVKKAFGGNE